MSESKKEAGRFVPDLAAMIQPQAAPAAPAAPGTPEEDGEPETEDRLIPGPDAQAKWEEFQKLDAEARRTNPHYAALREFRNVLAVLIDDIEVGEHAFEDEKSAHDAKLDVFHLVQAAHEAKVRLIATGYPVPDAWLVLDTGFGVSGPTRIQEKGWSIRISPPQEADALMRIMREANAVMMRLRHAPAPAGDAADAAPKGRAGAKANLRSWTQPDLDKAIHEFKAKRAASYAELLDGVKAGRKGAEKAADETFGRNAIARALGVKSWSMVSKSPAWIAIAKELGLPHGPRATGTRQTAKPGNIDFDIAVEQKSAKPADGADNAPADDAIGSAERQETIRLINRLAKSGKSDREKAERRTYAEELRRQLQSGEITDEQARQIVKEMLTPFKE